MSSKSKFMYYAAAAFYINHGGYGIYVKYRSNKNEIRAKTVHSRYIQVDCPDRTLYIVGDAHRATNMWELGISFDEYVSLSGFRSEEQMDALGIGGMMVNYTQYIGKEGLSPANMGQAPKVGDLEFPRIISDSGGYQVAGQHFDYISIKLLAEWYNQNANGGVVFDIPPSQSFYYPGLLKELAKVQAHNIEEMLKHTSDSLSLFNVYHGIGYKGLDEYIDSVEHPDIHRVCVGGAYHHSTLNALDALAYIISQKSKPHHTQFHNLGVSKVGSLYLLLRLCRQNHVPLLSSDSSTPLQEGRVKGYFIHPTMDSPPRYYPVGDKPHRPSNTATLSCSCAVCSAIKYADVLSVIDGSVSGFLLMYHNMYAFNAFTTSMYEVLTEASIGDAKQIVARQMLTRKADKQETLAGLDYLDVMEKEGHTEARKQYSYFLNAYEIGDTSPMNFAPQIDNGDTPGGQRMKGLISRYLNGGSGTKHAKVKVKDRHVVERGGHRIESSGSAVTPGKIKLEKGRKNAKKGKGKSKDKSLKRFNRKKAGGNNKRSRVHTRKGKGSKVHKSKKG